MRENISCINVNHCLELDTYPEKGVNWKKVELSDQTCPRYDMATQNSNPNSLDSITSPML